MIPESLLTMWSTAINILPNLAGAIIVLLVGFIIGRVVGKIVKMIIKKSGIDEWISEEDKISFKFSKIFSSIAKWVIYLVFIQQAAIFLGVEAITGFIAGALVFVYQAIAAAIIILVGYSLATYVKEKVITSNTIYSDIVSKVIFFLIIYISIAIGLKSFENLISTVLLDQILLVIIGSIGLGIAIAIGLGLKGAVAELAKTYTIKTKAMSKKK